MFVIDDHEAVRKVTPNLVRCTRGSSVTVKPENPLNHSDANDNP